MYRPSWLQRLLSVALLCVALQSPAWAGVLLQGHASDENNQQLAFSLSANSRSDVVGGHIVLGDARFEITAVSVHNLIGAKREYAGKTEYVIFSSSFSPDTATGQPWVVSQQYLACDQQYNSFLARYQLASAEAAALESPYRQLAESAEISEQSVVYCFISSPQKP